MTTITTYIYDKTSPKNISVNLPTSYEHLEDIFEKLDMKERLSAEFSIEFENGLTFGCLDIDNINIFELNHFANQIKDFDVLDIFKLQGAMQKIMPTEYDVATLINIGENIRRTENIEAYPATTEYELGEFYIENNLIPEITGITGDAKTWVTEHSDYELVGKEIKEISGGIFTGNAFVIVGNLYQLYNGDFQIPAQKEYAFKLEVGYNPGQDDGSRTILVLPDQQDKFMELLGDYEVVNLNELTCYKFESIIPQLEQINFSIEDIHDLNGLAKNISEFREHNQLLTYKAMLDALDNPNLEQAIKLCDFIDHFNLDTNIRDVDQYGISQLKATLPADLLDCLNTHEYGKKLLEKNGVDITYYGALIPRDGISLAEEMERAEQQQITQNQSMEMGGLS